VAFAGIIDEAQVLAEVSPTLVGGLLVEQEDVGVVLAEVVLHAAFATATEDVVATKIQQIIIIILLIMPEKLTLIQLFSLQFS